MTKSFPHHLCRKKCVKTVGSEINNVLKEVWRNRNWLVLQKQKQKKGKGKKGVITNYFVKGREKSRNEQMG
jgi:hypothetical protein